MGRPGMAEKLQNPTTQGGTRRCVRLPDPGSSGGVDREILPTRLPHRAPPPWSAHVSRGWSETSPTAKTVWPKNGSKRPNSGSTGFREFF